MYFVILGKHTQISSEELRYVQPTNFRTYNPHIVFFDTQFPSRLANLAGIVKRGEVVNYNTLKTMLVDCPIIGVHDSKFGKQAKQHFGIRRFKLLEPMHTDREIQEKGKEILTFQTKEWQSYGVVTGYQNIARYEVIDFDKPARSMQVGMMPAKLTHMMINIGLTYTAMDTMDNIYDPFCGLGTTLLMANTLWYHTIGSDIQPEHALKNIDRWKKFRHCEESDKSGDVAIQEINKIQKTLSKKQLTTDKNLYVFKHDVTQAFTEEKLQNVALIVSEGWLWPIVKDKTTGEEIQQYASQVTDVYSKFLKNIQQYYKKRLPTIVITVPYYIKQENHIAENLSQQSKTLWRTCKIIKEIYARPKQNVGRQICIFTADS